MTKTTHRTLIILAAFVWIFGGVMLVRKAGELLVEANHIQPASFWIFAAILGGILLGSIKAKYLFRKSCKKNIVRINAIPEPRLWQFYRPFFFVFLSLMIFAGVSFSRMAHGNFSFLLSVAVLDISIATALLGSSPVYWQEKAFVRPQK